MSDLNVLPCVLTSNHNECSLQNAPNTTSHTSGWRTRLTAISLFTQFCLQFHWFIYLFVSIWAYTPICLMNIAQSCVNFSADRTHTLGCFVALRIESLTAICKGTMRNQEFLNCGGWAALLRIEIKGSHREKQGRSEKRKTFNHRSWQRNCPGKRKAHIE